MKGTPWKGHGVWHMERAALLPPALWHSLFFCQCVCACVCGRLLINTYVHISNIFASVCCQFAAAPLCAVNYFCCLQSPPSYWQIHKHFATICFPFSTYPPPPASIFLLFLQQVLCISCWFLGLGSVWGFLVSLVSRFGNCKALSAVAFVNAKFCVCSAQIMQLICAQLQALCTHVSQPLLTFDSLLHF